MESSDFLNIIIRYSIFAVVQVSVGLSASRFFVSKAGTGKSKLVALLAVVALLGTLPPQWLLASGAIGVVVDVLVLRVLFSESLKRRAGVVAACSAAGLLAFFLTHVLVDVVRFDTASTLSAPEQLLAAVIFSAMDILLSTVGMAFVGRAKTTIEQQGKDALVGCWCMEVLTVALFAIHMLGTPAGLSWGAAVGIGLLCGSYYILTHFYAQYLKKCIIREEQRETIEAELARQEVEFAGVSGELTELRRLRHDYNNHMSIIQMMISEGKRNEAVAYLGDFQKRLQQVGDQARLELRDFGRFVGDQARILGAENISFAFDGEVPKEDDAGRRFLAMTETFLPLAAGLVKGRPQAAVHLRKDGKALCAVLRPVYSADVSEFERSVGNAIPGVRMNGNKKAGSEYVLRLLPAAKSDEECEECPQ